MPIITFRDEQGNITEREFVSRRVVIADFEDVSAEAVENDLDVLFEPAVPQRLEYDDEGSVSTITTLCGETENRRESDEGIKYVLEGIITEDQLSAAKTIKRGDNLTIVSDLHSGPITVKRITIAQEEDLVAFKENGEADSKLAFSFQMQFVEPDTTQ